MWEFKLENWIELNWIEGELYIICFVAAAFRFSIKDQAAGKLTGSEDPFGLLVWSSEGNFPCKEVQFKTFFLTCETTCFPFENINETLEQCFFLFYNCKSLLQKLFLTIIKDPGSNLRLIICLAEHITLRVTPAFGFVTECFFMTHHCLNLGEWLD